MEKIPATKLLHYDDTYLREFKAKVLQVAKTDGSGGIVLDNTAFYPTGGGQPSDKGIIEGKNGKADVVDVRMHACAYGGAHVKTTGELSVIKILRRSSKGKCVERLEFRAQSP